MPNRALGAGQGHGRDAESPAQKSVGDLEESIAALLNITLEVAILVNIGQTIQHIDSGNLNMVEDKTAIINTIKANLHSHVFNGDTWAWLHLLISDLDNEGVDALVLSLDDGLGKHDGVICMASTVGDPELLTQSSWTINSELLGHVVVGGSGLHLWSIVAVSKLSKAEASHVLQGVNFVHDWQVSLRVQTSKGTAKQVELHGELCGEISVDLAHHFVSSENVLGVSFKIED